MARLIILHVAGDTAVARQMCGDLPEFKPVPLRAPRESEPFRVGADVVLCLLWSPRVSADGKALSFVQIAELNPHNTVVARFDNAALPPALARLHLPLVEGFQSSQDLSAVLRTTGDRAMERVPEADPELRPDVWARREVGVSVSAAQEAEAARRRASHGFAGGMARGFASSVAMLGIGGSITMGVSDQLRDEGFFVLDANASTASYVAEELPTVTAFDEQQLFQPFVVSAEEGLSSFDQMNAEADALRELARVEREAIRARLADVAANLDASRKLTEKSIERLERAAGGERRVPQSQVASAPQPRAPGAAAVRQASVEVDPAPAATLQTAALQTASLAPADDATALFMADHEKAPTKLHDAAQQVLAKAIAARRNGDAGPQQI